MNREWGSSMSAFNTVHFRGPCPTCRAVVPLVVQFKYGDCYQHKYAIGEALRWGGNDVGRPEARWVVVDGAGESCTRCGSDSDFYVFISADHISSVESTSDIYDFVSSSDSFIVLEP